MRAFILPVRQDPALLVEFGAYLRRVREGAGLTQVSLAERLRMKPATVSRFESGDLCPTLTTMVALSRALGVPAPELLRGEGSVLAAPEGVEKAELLNGFRGLNEEDRGVVLGMVRRLAK